MNPLRFKCLHFLSWLSHWSMARKCCQDFHQKLKKISIKTLSKYFPNLLRTIKKTFIQFQRPDRLEIWNVGEYFKFFLCQIAFISFRKHFSWFQGSNFLLVTLENNYFLRESIIRFPNCWCWCNTNVDKI